MDLILSNRFTFFIFRNQFGQWFNWAVKKQQERIGESLRVGTSTAYARTYDFYVGLH